MNAGVRFNENEYYEINVINENITLIADVDGTKTVYDVTGGGGGGGYEEVLLWENPNPGSGFDQDLTICEDLTYDYYKIYWRTINNANVYLSVIVSKEDIETGSVVLGSVNESGDLFARGIKIEDGKIIASGLCSQVGADNTKKFRCLPNKVYGVTL